MAGHVKRKTVWKVCVSRAVAAEVDPLPIEADELPLTPGERENAGRVLAWLCDVVASGGTLSAVADSVGREAGYDVSREYLRRMLAHYAGDSASSALARAREEGAHGLAEQTIALTETPTRTPAESAAMRHRVSARQWVAAHWNRATYGEQQQPSVVISLPGLHLDALRRREQPANSLLAGGDDNTLPAEDVDAQVEA